MLGRQAFYVLIFFQADFTEVTRRPLVLSLRRKVYVILGIMFLCSVFVGVCLQLTSLGLRWWQNAITLLCYCLAWLMAWLFLLTCAALSATAKSIGDEMAQVWEPRTRDSQYSSLNGRNRIFIFITR
jgi:Ca2+/Na+ antiporter